MSDVIELLRAHWGRAVTALEPLDGGINADVWLAEHEGPACVVKQVPPAGVGDLATGCETATRLAEAGFVTGRPVPTLSGELLLSDHGLAVLELVPGRELSGETPDEQRLMGGLLGRIHAAGDPAPVTGAATFMGDWLSSDSVGIAEHEWLVRAIASVRAETASLALTWSTLHTDPAPEAFVHDDASGVTGLIDWAGSRRGPVLYDAASTVMYLGGTERAGAFLDAYREQAPLAADEMRHLDTFRRFREVVQGAYFARRLATGDITGDMDRAGNQKGLDDARRRWKELADPSVTG